MKKAIATLLTSALSLALLIYSASRGLDFIQSTLPPDKQILAFFALAATEGGILFWLAFFLYAARGGWQRAISLVLLVVDFTGAVALFTFDTLLRSSESGMIETLEAGEIRTMILALSGIIAANIAGGILIHVFDVDNQKSMATEEARDKIESAALKRLSEDAESVAAELAPQLAGDWMSDLRAQLSRQSRRATEALPAQIIEPKEKPAPLFSLPWLFPQSKLKGYQSTEEAIAAETRSPFHSNQEKDSQS